MSPVSGALAGSVFDALGGAFVAAARSVSTTAFAALEATTRIDLTASWFRANLGVIAAVTLPAVVALFVLQVIGSVLRREPGGLGRALTGVAKATLGAGLAVAVTQSALVATDQVCQVIASSAGTTVEGAALRFFELTWLAGPTSGPVLQVLLGVGVIVGSLMLWAVLLFRKAALLLVAVFAPIAFAGSAWDHTRAWTRRWIEAVVALVFCKIVIVVVFVVGLSAFASDGSTSTGAAEPTGAALSDLLVGLILLSIAVFAPWLTFKFVHWSGVEAAAVLGGAVAASPIPGSIKSTGSTAKYMATSAATTAVLGGAGGALRGAGAAKTGGAAAAGGSAPRMGPPPPTRPTGSGPNASHAPSATQTSRPSRPSRPG